MTVNADDGTEIITHRLEDLAATFLDLIDTPNTYVGAADFNLKVNLAENAVNFVVDENVKSSGSLETARAIPFFVDTTGKLIDGSSAFFNVSDDMLLGNSVSVGAFSDPATSASVDLKATDKALLNNRLTTIQRDALTPIGGMQIFNTTTSTPEIYNGTSWVSSVTTSGALTDNFLIKGNGATEVDVGGIAMSNDDRLIDITNPINPQDAATKDYVDSNIPDIKSGSIPSIAEGGNTSVVFTTAFSVAPFVVLNFEGNVDHSSGEKAAVLSVYSISTTGFTARYDAASPGVDPTTNVQWIATSAGNT